MQFQLKTFSIIVVMVLSGLEHAAFLDVTYEDIKAINGTCGGLDSCELPIDPDSLPHCSCGRFCSLLGTCCVDSMFKNTFPNSLKNIECKYIPGRKIHSFIPMINRCDPNLEIHKETKKLCNSNGEELSDPFLKIPVTDPITGISYKNYYCFACNENYGAEEPVPWNIEIAIKINDSYAARVNNSASSNSGSSEPNLQYDNSRRTWVLKVTSTSIPRLNYVKARGSWVMDYRRRNATNVEFTASFPEKLKNVTPVCYDMRNPVISKCAPDWTDENVRERCMAYMALISINRRNSSDPSYYYNPHCAICNYESMEDMDCYVEENDLVYPFWEKKVLLLRMFSLQDKTTITCEDSMVYDDFAKKCRRVYRARKRT